MGKKKDKKYRLKRQLQIEEDLYSSTYVTALVENTKRADCNEESQAAVKLAFENVYNYVSMDFDIEFPDQQKEAISKILEFEAILRKFRKAIAKEAKLRNKRAYQVLKAKTVKKRGS